MRLAVLWLVIFAAFGTQAKAADNPTMTIQIFNSSKSYNIYPVLSTGTSVPDKWLQSIFQVPKAQLGSNPYPKTNQFRFYINPRGNGIPPGGSVTVKLPLYTQLVPTAKVDPTKPDQYIDWWGGGRIELFAAPATLSAPPKALTANYTKVGQVQVTPISNTTVPICATCQTLKFFKDPAGLKGNDPSQLIEYTLGAINLNKDPYQLNTHNVDYDVSYVDSAYLPATMEPYGNPVIGYIGTPSDITDFRSAMNDFVAPTSPFAGWPRFIDNQEQVILKIPSALHILAGDPDLTPKPWPPLTKMRDLWDHCTKPGSNSTLAVCTPMRHVRTMFQANYNNYKSNYAALGCDPGQTPVALTEDLLYSHVHGWGPFNEFCGAATNLLENTPTYRAEQYKKYHIVKEAFDSLQYLPTGNFNPYALLIHGKDYINAPYVYAYSVDDAVGNMQVDGTGLIISVGGKTGLPNPNHATPPLHINFGYSAKDAIRFVKYGVCTATPNKPVDPEYASFDISTDNIASCVSSFIDNKNQIYKLKVKTPPPYPTTNTVTPDTHAPIDCSVNTSMIAKNWCAGVFAYSIPGANKTDSYIVAPAPAQP